MSDEAKQLAELIEKQAGIMQILLDKITALEVWQQGVNEALGSMVACDEAQQRCTRELADKVARLLKLRVPRSRRDVN